MYSFRRASNGNLLLYAWEVDSPHIKAFSVREIVGLRVTYKQRPPLNEIRAALEALE